MQINTPNRVLAVLGIGLVLSLLGDQTLYTVLPNPELAAEAGVTLGMVGILLGVNRLTRVLLNGPVGYLYDRLPRRALMIVSLGIGAFSTLLYALTPGPGIFLFGRILWGVAWAGIWIGSNTIALDISNSDTRGWVTGRLQTWFFLGIGLSSLAGGLFTDIFGYQRGLYLSSFLTTAGVILWVFLLPETRPKNQNPKAGNANEASGNRRFPWMVTFQASIPMFVLRLVFAGVVTSTTILWLGQFFKEGLSLSGMTVPLASMAGTFVAFRVLLSMLGAPAAGTISDRIHRRWIVMAVVMFLGMFGLWMMGVLLISAAVLGALLATLSAGAIQGLVPAIIGDEVDFQRQSRVIGAVYTIGDIGSAVGPPMALFLIPLIGIDSLFQICALLFGAAGIFGLMMASSESTRVK